MKENHACMNFPLSLSTEGAPVYEQKELRKQRKAPQGAVLRMAQRPFREKRAAIAKARLPKLPGPNRRKPHNLNCLLSVSLIQHLIQHIKQLAHVNGLGDMAVHPAAHSFFFILLKSIGRHRQDRDGG